MEVVGTNPCPHRACPHAHRACSMRAPMRTNAARPWARAPHGHASAWGVRAGCRARHASAWGVRAGCRARRKPMRLRGACAHGAARALRLLEFVGRAQGAHDRGSWRCLVPTRCALGTPIVPTQRPPCAPHAHLRPQCPLNTQK